jgi:hypothetical protein
VVVAWQSAWAAEVITMWPEPLSADVARLNGHTVLIRAHDGQGNAIANVLAAHGPRDAVFGEMLITDRNGGPKQRVRALALMVREALRYAASIGIVNAWTDVDASRPALLTFAQRMSGQLGDPFGSSLDATPPRRIGGLIYAMRSAALTATDADGNLTGEPIAGI